VRTKFNTYRITVLVPVDGKKVERSHTFKDKNKDTAIGNARAYFAGWNSCQLNEVELVSTKCLTD